VLLVSGLLAIGLRLKWRRPVAIGVAVVLSALIFSAFHYVGPYGDPLTLGSFTFRAIAGGPTPCTTWGWRCSGREQRAADERLGGADGNECEELLGRTARLGSHRSERQ
jgi:hypothetical protein